MCTGVSDRERMTEKQQAQNKREKAERQKTGRNDWPTERKKQGNKDRNRKPRKK